MAGNLLKNLSAACRDTKGRKREVLRYEYQYAIAIIIVINSLLRFNLDRHIKTLIGGAMSIGEGNLNHRVKVRQRGGEFVRLANAFNHMAGTISRATGCHNSLGRTAGSTTPTLRCSGRGTQAQLDHHPFSDRQDRAFYPKAATSRRPHRVVECLYGVRVDRPLRPAPEPGQ
jgi:HAMP domain-containing protein